MINRSRRLLVAGLLLLALTVMTVALPALATPLPAAMPGLHLSYPDAHTVRLTLSLADWQLAERVVDGQRYSELTIDGTVPSEQPGAPRVPVRGALLGVPTTDGLRIRVISGETTTVKLAHPLLPSPRVVLDESAPSTVGFNLPDSTLVTSADAAVYRQTAPYPAQLAAIGFSGVLRGQPVAQIMLNPVRYYPAAQQVEIYRSLVVDVSWPATARAPLAARSVTPVYEQLLAATLDNYATLARPTVLATVAAGVPHASSAPTANPLPLKLFVDTTGIYRLRHADLTAAGWDLNDVDPRNLQLTLRGAPVAMRIDGEADGVFDPDDEILFYGEAYEDLYVDQNVYWLRLGASAGLRIAARAEAPTADATAADFPTTLHLERDTYYWNTLTYAAADEDFWFWGVQLAPNAQGLDNTRSINFTLDHLPTTPLSSGAQSATLRVYLKGRTSGAHASRLLLNGHDLGQAGFNGTARATHSVTFDQALLVAGVNTLEIRAVNTGNIISQWHINWVKLDYHAIPMATGGQLAFTQPLTVNTQASLTGFNSPPLLLDVTQPAAPLALALPARAVSATVVLTTGQYYAATPDAYRTPDAIVPVQPSDWINSSNGADYIVISHAAFITAAQRLADHRAAQGLRAVVVDVQNIYDEFGDGFATPVALRTFLAHAYSSWAAPAPTYVVLVGDGSQDYKLLLGGDDTRFIPPRMINTNDYGQVPSDNWFVAFEGNDVLPEMLIGRLSVSTLAEADAVVATITEYDSRPADAGHVLFVADDKEVVFENTSTILIGKLPYHWQSQRIDVSSYATPTVARDITQTVAGGMTTMVNYAGHGNHFRWGSYRLGSTWHNILTADDALTLTGSGATPFWTALNCLNGFFSIPPAVVGSNGVNTFAEAMQKNAAIAVWADSALGYSSGQLLIMGHLYDAMFRDDVTGLGAATTEAKLRTVASAPFWTRMVETFILFGDPVSALNAPTPPYVTQTTPAANAAGVAVDAPIVVRFNKRMDPASVTLTDTLGTLYSASWNATQTQATFSHPAWPGGANVSVHVSGSDPQGQTLVAGPLAASWSFSTAVPTAVGLNSTQTASGLGLLWLLLLLTCLSAAVTTAPRRSRTFT